MSRDDCFTNTKQWSWLHWYRINFEVWNRTRTCICMNTKLPSWTCWRPCHSTDHKHQIAVRTALHKLECGKMQFVWCHWSTRWLHQACCSGAKTKKKETLMNTSCSVYYPQTNNWKKMWPKNRIKIGLHSINFVHILADNKITFYRIMLTATWSVTVFKNDNVAKPIQCV